mmetsp:Transcript_7016/g.20494  ORF Transcript_7016/g.20494 Transcript_7016/m.20494 type:complete len:400 (+) Transcript_7016:1409-2608(+)
MRFHWSCSLSSTAMPPSSSASFVSPDASCAAAEPRFAPSPRRRMIMFPGCRSPWMKLSSKIIRRNPCMPICPSWRASASSSSRFAFAFARCSCTAAFTEPAAASAAASSSSRLRPCRNDERSSPSTNSSTSTDGVGARYTSGTTKRLLASLRCAHAPLGRYTWRPRAGSPVSASRSRPKPAPNPRPTPNLRPSSSAASTSGSSNAGSRNCTPKISPPPLVARSCARRYRSRNRAMQRASCCRSSCSTIIFWKSSRLSRIGSMSRSSLNLAADHSSAVTTKSKMYRSKNTESRAPSRSTFTATSTPPSELGSNARAFPASLAMRSPLGPRRPLYTVAMQPAPSGGPLMSTYSRQSSPKACASCRSAFARAAAPPRSQRCCSAASWSQNSTLKRSRRVVHH